VVDLPRVRIQKFRGVSCAFVVCYRYPRAQYWNPFLERTMYQPACTCMSAQTPRRVDGIDGFPYPLCVLTRETGFRKVGKCDAFGMECWWGVDVWMWMCVCFVVFRSWMCRLPFQSMCWTGVCRPLSL
jgi:hypothetical protein